MTAPAALPNLPLQGLHNRAAALLHRIGGGPHGLANIPIGKMVRQARRSPARLSEETFWSFVDGETNTTTGGP